MAAASQGQKTSRQTGGDHLGHDAVTMNAIVQKINQMAAGEHLLAIGIAGAPGSGKSTFAETLAEKLGSKACVIPMDGFHMDNEKLMVNGTFDIKGAPETFERERFALLIDGLKSGEMKSYPTFDRAADQVVPDGGQVPGDVSILLFEGNYLLFDEEGWVDLAAKWDASIWLDVPMDVLEKRLVQRWLDHGLPQDQALKRAQSNDLVNAARVASKALPSTFVIQNDG